MGRVYLGVNDLVNNENVTKSNVIDYVTEKFPPTFISDGNAATFYDQALALNGRLIELGVYTQFNYFPVEQAGKLTHGFEVGGSKWGELTMQHLVRFLEDVVLDD
jgi:acetyl esterase/lipase